MQPSRRARLQTPPGRTDEGEEAEVSVVRRLFGTVQTSLFLKSAHMAHKTFNRNQKLLPSIFCSVHLENCRSRHCFKRKQANLVQPRYCIYIGLPPYKIRQHIKNTIYD